MRINNLKTAASAATLAIGTMAATGAMATDGFFQYGFGARHKALGGAGTAAAWDATAMSINPAGLVHAGNELDLALSIFVPDRGFTGSGGPGFTPSGSVDGNETKGFPIPNVAYSRPMGENGAFGFSLYGNGGMNTDYAPVTNPACGSAPFPAPNGVFCGGNAGVNLNQAFISVGYAHDFGQWSFGIAPILAVQYFEGKGLLAFGGVTSDPTALSNNETEYSTGLGVRIGAEVEVSENVRLGASYQSEMDMSKFDKYAGLFADQGDFDIPQNLNIGIAADVTPNLTLMFDYRWLNYEGVNAVGNATTVPLPFGSTNGPGFGWDDVDSYKFGAEWRRDDEWTFRAGFSTGNNPIGPEDVTLNILAPGVTEQHFTGGFEKKFGDRHALEMGVMYAPESTVSGIEVTPQGPNPGHTIEIGMTQYEVTVGWKINFDK